MTFWRETAYYLQSALPLRSPYRRAKLPYDCYGEISTCRKASSYSGAHCNIAFSRAASNLLSLFVSSIVRVFIPLQDQYNSFLFAQYSDPSPSNHSPNIVQLTFPSLESSTSEPWSAGIKVKNYFASTQHLERTEADCAVDLLAGRDDISAKGGSDFASTPHSG
jgi:hypothetical protein